MSGRRVVTFGVRCCAKSTRWVSLDAQRALARHVKWPKLRYTLKSGLGSRWAIWLGVAGAAAAGISGASMNVWPVAVPEALPISGTAGITGEHLCLLWCEVAFDQQWAKEPMARRAAGGYLSYGSPHSPLSRQCQLAWDVRLRVNLAI